MANRDKGEVGLTLNGTDYTFKLGTNALVELQEMVSASGTVEPIEAIWQQIGLGRVKYIRALIWAGLQKFHTGTTLDQVDDLLDSASEPEIQRLLSDLGLTTVPAKEDAKELSEGGSKKRNPRTARKTAGTGGTSSSTPAPSV